MAGDVIQRVTQRLGGSQSPDCELELSSQPLAGCAPGTRQSQALKTEGLLHRAQHLTQLQTFGERRGRTRVVTILGGDSSQKPELFR